jgi:hypothetical protein
MAGNVGWTNPRPNEWTPDAFRAIFHSLETFLRNPKFNNGVSIGTGGTPTYNPSTGTTAAPTLIELNGETVAIFDEDALQSDNYDGTNVETGDATAGWRIERNSGSAEFQDLRLRGEIIGGTTVVGATEVVSGGAVQSDNYSAGSTGWAIDGDGSAEFNDVTVRGAVVADTFRMTDDDDRIQIGEDEDGHAQAAVFVFNDGEPKGRYYGFEGGIAVARTDSTGNAVGHYLWLQAGGTTRLNSQGTTIITADAGGDFGVIADGDLSLLCNGSTIIDNVPCVNVTALNALSGAGSNWSEGSALRVMAGSAVPTFTAGAATLNYGTSFNGVVTVVVSNGDGTVGPDTVLSTSAYGTSSCTVHAYDGGVAVNGAQRRVNFWVFGW